ncbi:hypothetical protein [Aliikangiella sp. G2MR2-5]|uniref:hypothetical protein n=1 Tax=Aliikangiella sp. G2MR2-5 TaxID=2788943 RepID=UPI0018ABBCCC|nr:hypothetical protein [Aliikangiella sp. G2MR2-5]
MIFFYDSFDQSVEAFASLDITAKHILGKVGVSIELGKDPVELAKRALGNRGKVVGYAGAFDIISKASDKEAQELALKFKTALERARK